LKIYEVYVNRRAHTVKVLGRQGSAFMVEVNGKSLEVKVYNISRGRLSLEISGGKFQAELSKTSVGALQVKIGGGKTFGVQFPKVAFTHETPGFRVLSAAPARKPSPSLPASKDAVIAPMAGRIVALKVSVGQRVSKGECICILEAMKMANEVAAPKDGVVKEVLVSEGAVVNEGDVLAVIA
jgi:biotin carboxyl carrier protein